jgi:hypothetical protein
MSDELRILATYRTAEQAALGRCPLCERERSIVFDVTVSHGLGELEALSVCDECAPRASRLLAWLREHMA